MDSRTIKAIDESENLKDALIDALRELDDVRAQLAEARALLREAVERACPHHGIKGPHCRCAVCAMWRALPDWLKEE